jgi:hypothetical protein
MLIIMDLVCHAGKGTYVLRVSFLYYRKLCLLMYHSSGAID